MKFKGIAEEAGQYWKAFIEICGKMEGKEMEGEFARSIAAFLEELGVGPGEELQSLIGSHAAEMSGYIDEVDEKDREIY